MTVADFARYWEGGNKISGLVMVVGTLAAVLQYSRVSAMLMPYAIDTQVLLSYSFNLFAIALGSLLALFSLLAAKPTEFLVRIRNTRTFALLIANIKITMLFCTLVLILNFGFGVVKIEPSKTLDLVSIVFVFWCGLALATIFFLVRTVRTSFLALT